ncbi:hypothetical protein BDN67DRAFT_985064 [Paxillus ammoniavirescens]|nr:hypothetical protein BDN67DRAFT_985064 [Paxillus ammoniavirescens]
MSDDMVKKAIMAKQATRETQHHHVLTLAWDIKEAEQHRGFLRAAEVHCKKAFNESCEEAAFYERMMAFEDISAFSTTKEQLDQLEDYALENGLANLDMESDSVADGSMMKSPCA